jgi:Skp family chaperone for outer membrane proteins
MQKRAVRVTLLALLLASGIAAAIFVWTAEQRIGSIDTERAALETTTERLSRAVGSIAAAQQAYVDYGQRDEASFARISALLDQIAADIAALRSTADDPASTTALADFDAALAQVRDADGQARNNLMAGESLAAADVLLDAARAPVALMEARARAVRQGAADSFRAERATVAQRSWVALGAVGLLWMVGLMLLTPVPAPTEQPQGEPDQAAIPEPVPTPGVPPQPERAGVDLAATAALCADISKLTDTLPLPDILRRAAAILEARGIVIWMGAGEELFAATAHGYEPAIVSRLRPIGRRAENATAAAWRTGDVRIVAAEGSSHGAIVAPMTSVGGTVGVMAAEVRHGRENDAATRAVTAIIATQLAGVLSAWPAASTADSATSEGAMDAIAADSDRQAAAS